MGHNLDIITGTDGRRHVNFVSKNLVAWHKLGEVFTGMNLSVPQGMDLANLNGWNVRKVPLVAQEMTEDGVTTFEEPGVFQVRRTNPITRASERLGSVGTEFTHIQNEEASEYFAALLGETGAGVETMGALDSGRRTFFCAKLPQGINVGGADPHDLYVALLNGHVGDAALRTIITPVRIVCANTEAAAIGRANQSWSIRHTKNAKAALEAAKQSTEKAWAFLTAYDEEAQRMLDTPATFAHVEKAAERLWPLPKYINPDDPTAGERAKRNRIERIEVLRGLWEGPTSAPIEGTRWAAYNVLTEYVDHYARATGEDDTARGQNRAASALLKNGFNLKTDAWRLLKV